MAKYKLIVLINAIEGREDEFNDWFSNQHMHDSLKVPGMKTAQRFELTDDQWPEASRQWRYMTLYDVETDDVAGVIAELRRRGGTPEMPSTDTIQPPVYIHVYEPITDFVESSTD